MLTPPKGDSASVPLDPEGRRVAGLWDPAQDKPRASSAAPTAPPRMMRMPLRAHITWANDWTLKIDTDAGKQTRLLRFRPVSERPGPGRGRMIHGVVEGGGVLRRPCGPEERFLGRLSDIPDGSRAPLEYGTLKVVTTGMRPGYFRRNGVPYSENAVVTEYFDRHGGAGFEWFTVTTVVEDPKYLAEPFVTSSPSGAKPTPRSCGRRRARSSCHQDEKGTKPMMRSAAIGCALLSLLLASCGGQNAARRGGLVRRRRRGVHDAGFRLAAGHDHRVGADGHRGSFTPPTRTRSRSRTCRPSAAWWRRCGPCPTK